MRYLLLGLLLLGGGSLEAQDDQVKPSRSLKSFTLADALITFRSLIDQPAPPTMSQEDLTAYQKQTEWLKSVVTRMEVTGGVKSPRDAASGQATGKRQHKPIMMTTEMEALRAAVEAESKLYTMMSNLLKARHDEVMNVIRNMRQ